MGLPKLMGRRPRGFGRRRCPCPTSPPRVHLPFYLAVRGNVDRASTKFDRDQTRHRLAVLLAEQPYAVSSFPSAREFLAAAASLPGGCLIVDMRMPGMPGLELQQHLNERALYFPTIVITGHGDVPLAVRAMKEGAVDFIEKPYQIEAIIRAIEVALGRLGGAAPRDPAATEATARLELLTPREREVLEGLLAGLPNKTIAYDLAISPRTVEVHRARVMQKLEARSLSEVVRLALAAGLSPRAR
jgi:two-component system, LuxR family, response regulator FixJ